jgi:hypothetical protein
LHKNEDEKVYFPSIIQKLQTELDIPVREFAEVDMAIIDQFTNKKIKDVDQDED